jgi:hypothetical protein
MGGRQVNRWEFIGSAAAGASATFVGAPAIAQRTARVVVIGGGFAGATCARQLKRFNPQIQVTLVETNPTFTACPFSNAVIAGLCELNAQQFSLECSRELSTKRRRNHIGVAPRLGLIIPSCLWRRANSSFARAS